MRDDSRYRGKLMELYLVLMRHRIYGESTWIFVIKVRVENEIITKLNYFRHTVSKYFFQD